MPKTNTSFAALRDAANKIEEGESKKIESIKETSSIPSKNEDSQESFHDGGVYAEEYGDYFRVPQKKVLAQVAVRIPDDALKVLSAVSKYHHTSMTNVVANIIHTWIKDNKDDINRDLKEQIKLITKAISR